MANETGSGGGGSGIDLTQSLSMTRLINNFDSVCENPSPSVLYSESINKAAVEAEYNNLKALVGDGNLCSNITTGYSDIETLNKNSGSAPFYSNPAASAQWTSLGNVSTAVSELASTISGLSWEDISAAIDDYNEKLAEAKKDARIKLLVKAADTWNKAKHIKEGYPKRDLIAEYPRANDTTWFTSESDTVVYGESKNIRYNAAEIPSYEGVTIPACKYDWYEYKVIKTWSGFKSLHWFNDPGFAEVEKKFEEVGCPLPYIVSQIKE